MTSPNWGCWRCKVATVDQPPAADPAACDLKLQCLRYEVANLEKSAEVPPPTPSLRSPTHTHMVWHIWPGLGTTWKNAEHWNHQMTNMPLSQDSNVFCTLTTLELSLNRITTFTKVLLCCTLANYRISGKQKNDACS